MRKVGTRETYFGVFLITIMKFGVGRIVKEWWREESPADGKLWRVLHLGCQIRHIEDKKKSQKRKV